MSSCATKKRPHAQSDQISDPMDEDLFLEGECAICFEPVSQYTVLPCSCKVSYCLRCWDRALAESFNSCGEARCPTCRAPVCVDFDPDQSRLVFTRDAMPLTVDLGLRKKHAQDKLR